MRSITISTRLVVAGLLLTLLEPVAATTRLKDICRLKGQEENTLHGLGLVVGLKGTGDGGNFLPAIRSLATAMQLMGNPIGQGGAAELKDARNVALVMVTATVPGAGARQGDKLDCYVSAIGSAKSLEGGRLFITAMQGPLVESPVIYAFAQGAIEVEDPRLPTTGKVHKACRLEEEFFNPFLKEGRITLVLDERHAGFQMAQEVAELINSRPGKQTEGDHGARALDQVNIEVVLSEIDLRDPVEFISGVLNLPLFEVPTPAQVVIHEKSGAIVVGEDVEISPVIVSHKNLVVEAGRPALGERFVPIAPGKEPSVKLKALVEALNAVKAAPADIIDILKAVDRSGKLHGRLIIE